VYNYIVGVVRISPLIIASNLGICKQVNPATRSAHDALKMPVRVESGNFGIAPTTIWKLNSAAAAAVVRNCSTVWRGEKETLAEIKETFLLSLNNANIK